MTFKLYSERNLRQLKAIRLKFRHNLKGFTRRYRFLLILLLLGAIFDCISTCHFMVRAGIQYETHPHILLVSCYLGPIWGPIVGKSVQLLLGLPIVVFIRKYAAFLLATTSLLYFTASFFNLFVFGIFDSTLVYLFMLF